MGSGHQPPVASSCVNQWLLIDIASGAVLACFTLDHADAT